MRRRSLDRWLKDDPQFARDYAAKEDVADMLEAEAIRRGVKGWKKPIFSQRTGELLGHEEMYDGKLLQTLLAAHRPERYRQQAQAVSTAPVVIIPWTANQLPEAPAIEVEARCTEGAGEGVSVLMTPGRRGLRRLTARS